MFFVSFLPYQHAVACPVLCIAINPMRSCGKKREREREREGDVRCIIEIEERYRTRRSEDFSFGSCRRTSLSYEVRNV